MSGRVIDPASTAAATLAVEESAQLLVIGAGPAGLAAAIEGVRLGLSVVLVDENPIPARTMGDDIPLHFGQRMTGAVQNLGAMLEAFVASDPAVAEAFDAGVDVRLGVVCFGLYGNGPSVGWLPGKVAGLTDGARSWMLGFGAVVVASGRRDMGLAFPGWELPGVMGVTAARLLALRYGALAARRAVLLGTTAEAIEAAEALRSAGVEIAAVIEPASAPLTPCDFAVFAGHAIQRAEAGLDGVAAAVFAAVDADGHAIAGTERRIDCDTILLGIGAVPLIELLDAMGCRTRFDPARGGHVPILDAGLQTGIAGVFAAGDCAGIWGAKTRDRAMAEAEGRHAAAQAAIGIGVATAPTTVAEAPAGDDISAYRLAWVRASVIGTGGAAHVCQCEEVSARDILDVRPPRYLGWERPLRNATDLSSMLGNGPPSPDQVKRLTRAGMGLCQGRRCREQIAALLALGAGGTLADQPLATHRAPVRPLPLRAAAMLEPPEVEKHWDVWFGIASQVTPFWEIAPVDEP